MLQVNPAQATMNTFHMAQGIIAGCLCAITAAIIETNLKELTNHFILSNAPQKVIGAQCGYWIGVGIAYSNVITLPSLSRMITTRTRNRIQRNQQALQPQLQQLPPAPNPLGQPAPAA